MLYAVRCVLCVGDRGVSPVLITPETLTFKADQAMSGQDSRAHRFTVQHGPYTVVSALSGGENCLCISREVWWLRSLCLGVTRSGRVIHQASSPLQPAGRCWPHLCQSGPRYLKYSLIE